jgi:hypothetical protein
MQADQLEDPGTDRSSHRSVERDRRERRTRTGQIVSEGDREGNFRHMGGSAIVAELESES